MAKYTVSHACGHTAEHQLTGPGKDWDRKLAWLEGADCTRCWQAKKDAARAVANEAAAAEAGQRGLPTLTGSERQVAWAESIRLPITKVLEGLEAEVLDQIGESYSETEPGDFSAAAVGEIRDAVALLTSEVLGRTEARWWIDERDYGACIELGQPRRAAHWAWEQIHERGLAPTYEAEREAMLARRKAEAEAKRVRASRILAEIQVTETTVSISGNNGWDLEIRDGDRVVKFPAGNSLQVLEDGESLGHFDLHRATADVRRPGLYGETRAIADAARVRARAAQARDRCDSLAGVTVTAAVASRKRESNLTVTLSDGRTAIGSYTKKDGAEIETVAGGAVDADHAEVLRIAAEAGKVVVRA